MKVKIKSKYIHYGVQVFEKEIDVSKDELKMLDNLKLKYEVKEKEKKPNDIQV